MGRRYYCDFCDKAFADNLASKKNHFNGMYHQQMRRAHYDAFRDPASVLAVETAKKPCRKFFQTGLCDFGDGCRFSHLTEERRRELQQLCQVQQRGDGATMSGGGGGGRAGVVGELHDWLTKHKEKAGVTPRKRRKALPQFSLPPHLTDIPDLPPSLLPPTKEDFVNLPLLEWG